MSKEDIPYRLAIDALLSYIPEIRTAYDVERAKWRGNPPPTHVVYGSLFVSLLQGALERFSRLGEGADESIIDRSFKLMETLASSEDFETRCIVQASVLESLLEDDSAYQSISGRFGPHTKQMALKLLTDWHDDSQNGASCKT